MHILTVIPSTFSGIIVLDKFNRFTLDPYKTLFFGICSTGIIYSLFDPSLITQVDLISGGISFCPVNMLKFWILLMISLIFLFLFYYLILICKRSPPVLRKKFIVNLFGSAFFGGVTFFFFFTKIINYFPGIEMVSMGFGAFISSFSFLISPDLLKVILNSADIERVKNINKFLPICAKCKKIRDNENNWHQIEDYLLVHSEIKFTHGFCPECEKEILSEIDQDK